MSEPIEGGCPLPKPPLPPGASPEAYYSCNSKTKEWEYHDPWIALTFGGGFVMSTKDGKSFTISKLA